MLQIGNYEARTSNLNAKYCASSHAHRSATGILIVAVSGFFVRLLRTIQFPALQKNEPSRNQRYQAHPNARDTMLASPTSSMLLTPCLICHDPVSVACFDFFIFPTGTPGSY